MSKAMTTLSAPPPLRSASLSQPEQARLVLTGTAGLICSILILWLIGVRLIRPPVENAPVWAMALPSPDGLADPVRFASSDARRFSGEGPAATTTGTSPRRLERELSAFLERRRGRPCLVYLSAAGVSWSDGATSGPFLPSAGEALGQDRDRIPLDGLFDLLKSRDKNSRTLLVLDVGQGGPDRELGLYGGDLEGQIKEKLGKDSRLAVLLACAPGQISWVAEGRGTSVFAHYLAEALEGRAGGFGGASAGDLLAYIRPRVERWVRQNRGNAVQTPVLIGDPGLRVALPGRPPRVKATTGGKEATKKVREDLAGEWSQRQRLAAQATPPYRESAIAWRRYQFDLLRAERLLRSSAPESAALMLDIARGSRSKVEQPADSSTSSRPWSLALARWSSPAGLRVDPDRYEENVGRLLQKLALDVPAPADAPPVEEKPKDADAKPGDTPKAAKAPVPKAKAATPKADTAPAETDPLEVLTDGAGSSTPHYVEGQVPVWYAQFSRRGGESPDLREDRIRMVGQAFEVRKQAELACRDARIIPWIRPLIDQADPIRRTAQDFLFSTDPKGLTAAKSPLDQAEDLAKKAAKLANDVSRAASLLERLQDDLPYYGDWVARGRGSADAEFRELLDGAGRLADLAYSRPAEAGLEKSRAEMIELATKLDRLHRDLRDRATQYAAQLVSSGDWREIDAVLYLPMLDPKTRTALLERAGSEELSPPFDSDASDSDDSDKPAPDPAFWTQAIQLANAEVGLLKMGGADVSSLSTAIAQAEKSWKGDTTVALSSLATFAARDRSARSGLAADDRSARILPVVELRRLESDPCKVRDQRDRRDLLVWQGLRLCDDFAAREARQVLSEVRVVDPNGDDDLRKAIKLASDRSGARLNIDLPDSGQAQVTQVGDLPKGDASAFVSPDPSRPGFRVSARFLGTSEAPGPSLLSLPANATARLSFEGPNGRPVGRQRPTLFYRGRFFAPREEATSGTGEELVKVEIEQRYHEMVIYWTGDWRHRGSKSKIKVPDQFGRDRNRGRGFLHPVNPLDYRLKITNLTQRPLRLFVSHGLDDTPPYTDTLNLSGGQTSTEVVGLVSPNDLPELGKPGKLLVRITEEDAQGRTLAKDLVVPFTKVNPTEADIGTHLWYSNGYIHLEVTHSKDDRVTSPALVSYHVEPFNAVAQIDYSSHQVPLGQTTHFVYQVIQEVEALTFTLKVDEVPFKPVKYTIMELRDKPPPPGAEGAAPPGGAAPKAGSR